MTGLQICNKITAITAWNCCLSSCRHEVTVWCNLVWSVTETSGFKIYLLSSTESLEPTYQQLQKMKLDKSPFVVVSVIGQELLTASHHTASVVVLEAALKIGTCSLKLRGSVFSALSSAHWSLGNIEKSTGYMQQDLEVAKTLGKKGGWKSLPVLVEGVYITFVRMSGMALDHYLFYLSQKWLIPCSIMSNWEYK